MPPAEDLLRIAQRMVAIMLQHRGIGLAAPQVGLSIRLIVVEMGSFASRLGIARIFANPEIKKVSGPLIASREGCLTLPGVSVVVPRRTLLTVQAFEPKGDPYAGTLTWTKATFQVSGVQARIFQHEIDHLDGIMITRYRQGGPRA